MSDPSALAQDPRELFDVVTADGQLTGVTKARADVHRDGDWHRAIHVWVVGIDEQGPFLTLQRRSAYKDTWPGKLDATVGGHFRAGEAITETLREVEEEIGIRVELADLRPVGVRIAVSEVASGAKDRELQHVYLLRDDRPLSGFRPNPAELDGLIRLRLADALELLSGMRSESPARAIENDARTIFETTVAVEEFISRVDRYFYRVAIATERFLKGEIHIAV